MASTDAVLLFPSAVEDSPAVPVASITAPLHVSFTAAGRAFHKHWESRARIRSASHTSVPDADVEADAGSSKVEGGDAVTDKSLEAAIMDDNLYGILGLGDIGCDATDDQIKKAYRKLLLKYHPDKKVGSTDTKDTDAKFMQVQKAFDVLSDEKQRRGYDSQFDFDDSIPPSDAPLPNAAAFFDLYRPVFRRNARFSERRPVPQLGDENTDMDTVLDFYNFWFKFKSWRDFSKYDEHDVSQAEFREEKRWMERQNASARAKLKAKEIKRVAQLAEQAYTVDPRVRAWKREQKDAKRRAREAKAAAKKAEEDRIQAEKDAAAAAAAASAAASKQQRDALKKRMKKLRKKFRGLCADAVTAGAEPMDYEDIDEAAQSCDTVEELERLCQQLEATPGSLQAVEDYLQSVRTEEQLALQAKKQKAKADAKAALEKAKREAEAAFVPWSDAELSMLAKAIAKYPGGTKRRWKIISDMVNQLGLNHRSADDCATKYKALAKDAAIARAKAKKEEEEEAAKAAATAAAPEPAAATPPTAPTQNGAGAGAAAGAVPWTPMQQEALEAALVKYPGTMEKNARWNAIANAVPGRTKKECVMRYKELVQALRAKKAGATDATAGGAAPTAAEELAAADEAKAKAARRRAAEKAAKAKAAKKAKREKKEKQKAKKKAKANK